MQREHYSLCASFVLRRVRSNVFAAALDSRGSAKLSNFLGNLCPNIVDAAACMNKCRVASRDPQQPLSGTARTQKRGQGRLHRRAGVSLRGADNDNGFGTAPVILEVDLGAGQITHRLSWGFHNDRLFVTGGHTPRSEAKQRVVEKRLHSDGCAYFIVDHRDTGSLFFDLLYSWHCPDPSNEI
ncbi:hypothetical protein [Corynebacterium lujinxingii]|uniref:Uncharacterized protein n=1 Tax=Corynebacterium lujinxingii TaxID=2763010 RepID=A0A7H0JWS3_9CORY|nr:hypothetical protein [Corynebacterium lujinxingii]MBC3178096.1 hypothetical protein [Corynebacterium lujinxingii]QNP89489.1 hypothetical protein IAU68_07190 [Corynebacterium lujinxingii]